MGPRDKMHPFVMRILPLVLFSLMMSVSLSEGAPETISIPILKSIMDGSTASAEKLKELVKSHPAVNPNPSELQKIISKLNQQPGSIDPVMQDMLQAFERTHRDTKAVLSDVSMEHHLHFPNEDAASNRVASSTEENGIIWHDMTRAQRRDFTKFSSRYRSNQTGPNSGLFREFANYKNAAQNQYEQQNETHVNSTDHQDPYLPFHHVTDPNLRNHRLYAWEFETYKNFTHIDQPEDLMADEDIATETKVSPVAVAPPPSTPPNNQLQQHPQQSQHSHSSHAAAVSAASASNKTEKIEIDPNAHLWQPKPTPSKSKRVKVKGIPHIVISLEDTSDTHHQFPGYNFQFDSGEHSGQRPREPLRQSSTENLVYVHNSAEDGGRYQFNDMEDGENDPFSRRFPPMGPHSYRPPNPNEPSDALFIDPDQDFFTSTIRTDQEISSETMPKRRRKKLKKVQPEDIDEANQSNNRFSNRMGDRFMEHEDNLPNIHYSPMYSKNKVQGSINEDRARSHYGPTASVYRTPGPHFPMMRPTPKYFGMGDRDRDRDSRYKQDRILNAGDTSSSSGAKGTGNGGDEAASPSNFETYDAATLSHLNDGGHIGNYYSLHGDGGDPGIGLHANLGASAPDHSLGSKHHPFANHDTSSAEYNGGGHKSRLQNVIGALMPFSGQMQNTKKLQATPTDQIIAPGNLEDFYHPYAEADHQVNHIPDESTIAVSWSNTWYLVAALVAFTAMFVLLLPSLIHPARMGKKDTRHDLEEDDFNTSTYQGSGTNNLNTYHYDNTNNDVNQNADLWTEIKGVYNDLVNMFRGDYSLLSKLNKKPDGPKIVYRDDDEEEEDSEEEEDDERERLTLRNRKKDKYSKKQAKKQQKQQQNKQQQQQQNLKNQNQAKNMANMKKTLISKAKVSAGGRDNKESTGKTIEATSVNNLVVVSGPGPSVPMARKAEKELKEEPKREEKSSGRSSLTDFVLADNSTMATMPFINTTGYGNVWTQLGYNTDGISPFLKEWAQVQLINNHN